MKPIIIIVACDIKNGIAKDGNIPWFYKKDLDHFRKTTTQCEESKINAVIMGKNSWKTIPEKYRGLSNRFNVVVSTTMTDEELITDNKTNTPAIVARSFDDALDFCEHTDNISNIFICGGERIYQEAIRNKVITESYITLINKDYQCTSFFPMDEYTNFIKTECMIDMKVLDISPNDDLQFMHTKIEYNPDEYQYLNLLKTIIKQDRQGRNTRNSPVFSIFGPQIEFNLANGFPLLTTKKMFWRGIVEELLFFLRGQTDTKLLSDKNVHIWDPNTTREFLDSRKLYDYAVGDMGPMYGFVWRHQGCEYEGCDKDYTNKGFDQLKMVIDLLLNDPTSRRTLMTTYDPSKVDESVLAPCHGIAIQFYVQNNYLSCKMYQRQIGRL